MEQSEFLRYAVDALEKLGLRYFVTGSTASIFYGEPRFTNDIDVVVDLDPEDVPRLGQLEQRLGRPGRRRGPARNVVMTTEGSRSPVETDLAEVGCFRARSR